MQTYTAVSVDTVISYTLFYTQTYWCVIWMCISAVTTLWLADHEALTPWHSRMTTGLLPQVGTSAAEGSLQFLYAVSIPLLARHILWKAAFRGDNCKTLPPVSIQLIKELDLFWRWMPARLVDRVGEMGQSTTTSLSAGQDREKMFVLTQINLKTNTALIHQTFF